MNFFTVTVKKLRKVPRKMPALVFLSMERVRDVFFFLDLLASFMDTWGGYHLHKSSGWTLLRGPGTGSNRVICPPGPQWTRLFRVPITCFPWKHQSKFLCFLKWLEMHLKQLCFIN